MIVLHCLSMVRYNCCCIFIDLVNTHWKEACSIRKHCECYQLTFYWFGSLVDSSNMLFAQACISGSLAVTAWQCCLCRWQTAFVHLTHGDVSGSLRTGTGWGGAPPSLAQWCDQEEHGKEKSEAVCLFALCELKWNLTLTSFSTGEAGCSHKSFWMQCLLSLRWMVSRALTSYTLATYIYTIL